MFTGIVQKVGTVLGVKSTSGRSDAGTDSGGLQLVIDSGFTQIALGESVAVNGVCLTATESTSRGELFFFVSTETLRRSNLGELREESRVNLERALRSDERLSGHIVQGHVDGLAKLARIVDQGESREMRFELPAELARYCVEKGSIALNGVSLTINSISEGPKPGASSILSLVLIPHTWQHTNLSSLNVSDPVNVEIDVIAKYVEKLCRPYPKHSNS